MAKEIIMPKLAMAMNEGSIIDWKFVQGDLVEKGQALLEVETEKVSYEIEATGTGLLHLVVVAGETVPVEQVIGYLADNQEELDSLAGDVPVVAAVSVENIVDETETQGALVQEQLFITAGTKNERANVSPLAKKLSRQNNIEIARISGTGPKGRIVKKDILAAIEAIEVAESSSVVAPVSDETLKVRASIPLKGMRKAIADNMMLSLTSTAQLSFTEEIDATEIVRLRKRLVGMEEKIGIRVSYNDIIALIVARAAMQQRIVNSSIVGNEINIWEDVNLGIAIATEVSEYESGLFVPVVKDAGRKTLLEISREIKELSTKARTGKLAADDMRGGTLTMSSAAYTSALVSSTPVLTPGQALLAQPGPIIEKPVVRDGEIVIRSMMTMNYTFDHRILDGVPLGKFSQMITDFMAEPGLLL